MHRVALAIAALIAWSAPAQAASDSAETERWRAAMESARWTGPLLASSAEALPKGHFYTEPYFYDVIAGGKHHPGSSGYYQYGLLDNFTVGVQPSFGYGTERANRGPSMGDFKLLSQLRISHFTADHRVPSVAIVLQEEIPTGKFDRLGEGKSGHGTGSFATEVGINFQQYFLLPNDRLLRARINILEHVPHGTDVRDRSVYGTALGFRGHARPGARTTLVGAFEYSLTKEWVLAFDVIGEWNGKTRVKGSYLDGSFIDERFAKTRSIGFAPAVEYNWSDTSGVIFGVWITPKGHNVPSSVIPAIAYSRFW